MVSHECHALKLGFHHVLESNFWKCLLYRCCNYGKLRYNQIEELEIFLLIPLRIDWKNTKVDSIQAE